ncbi:PHF5-like protein, partial [Plasmodium cynomolgi strain B]
MHQNLREDSKTVKSILTECLGGVTTPPLPVSKEGEEDSLVVTSQWSPPSGGRGTLTRGKDPRGGLIWTDGDEDLTKMTPKRTPKETTKETPKRTTKKTTKIFFKFEPFIIHVKCANLVSALRLLKVAQMAGLKQSGLLNFNRYVTVAIRGSMRLEHYVEGARSLQEDSIVKLLDVCNGKMDQNLRQLVWFYHCYREKLSDEGHIRSGTSPVGGDSSLQWKLLSNEEDLDKLFVWGHDMFIEEGNIYLFGGFAKGVRSRELKIFDVGRKSLRTYETPLPALSYHCFFRLDSNYACVFGGRRSPKSCTSDVWLYDVRRNAWCAAEWRSSGEKSRGDGRGDSRVDSRVDLRGDPRGDSRGDSRSDGEDASRPCGRYRHACAFVRRYRKKEKEVYLFYVHGGVTEKNEVLNDLWVGKLTVQGHLSVGPTAIIEWERKHCSGRVKQEGEEVPSPFVKNHTMVYNKRRNLIHIVGGCSSPWAEGVHPSQSCVEDSMDRLHTYDLKKDCFFYVHCGVSEEDGQAAFPLNRFSHATCAWGHNDFVLMGGLNMHRTLNDVWFFRMKESKWYRLGVFPFHSMYVRAKIACEGDYLYVEVKTALERIGAFDKGRKIEVYKAGTASGNDENSFLVPVVEKIEKSKNYEQVRQFFPFEKIQLTKEGHIFYIYRSSHGRKEKTNLKQCLTNLFYSFANEKVKSYLSESERKLIVRASAKYEVIGGIVIFHYRHMGSVLRLYRRCVEGSASKYMEMGTGKYTRLRTLLKKCRRRKLISYVDALWLDVRDAFNRFRGGRRGGEDRRQPRLRLRCIKTFLKFSSLARRRTVLRGQSSLAQLGRAPPCRGKEKAPPCRGKEKACLFNHPWCSLTYVGRRAVKVDQLAKMKKQLKYLRDSEYGKKNNPRGKRIKTIAIYEHIEGVKRKNLIHLVLGRNTKTMHIENNVVYKLDLEKCMFCSGNGTEKERIKNLYLDRSNMVVSKEIVVDLFCGVGYFTLPLLKLVGEGKIKEYYACDINGDSLRLLRDAVKLNKMETSQLHLLRQNSFVVTKNAQLLRRCHRVLLGLLPHSVEAWCNAFQLLDGQVGGTLHIHGIGESVFQEQFVSRVCTYDYVRSVKGCSQSVVTNLSLAELVRHGLHVTEGSHSGGAPSVGQSCPRGEEATSGGGDKLGKTAKGPYRGNNVPTSLHFAQFVLLEIFKLALKDYLAHKTNWVISILHVERVKSYAPRVYHYVVDVRCTPEKCSSGE